MNKHMYLTLVLLVVLAAFCVTAFAQPAATMKKTEEMKMMQAKTQADLRVNMRMLWDAHVTYTRNYIISALAGLGDAEAVAGRLMRNQEDIGDAIKPYYGDEGAKKLTSLLKDHISTAAEVVAAAMKGEKEPLEKAQAKWEENAEMIATFLSSANPNWGKGECSTMLKRHLALTTDEVTSRLMKNWDKDIMAYDEGHQHMMMFADFLTNGIAKQFPSMMADK